MVSLAESLGLKPLAMASVREGAAGTFRAGGVARLNWSAREAVLHLKRV